MLSQDNPIQDNLLTVTKYFGDTKYNQVFSFV